MRPENQTLIEALIELFHAIRSFNYRHDITVIEAIVLCVTILCFAMWAGCWIVTAIGWWALAIPVATFVVIRLVRFGGN